jgi:hypothetical protein
MRSAASRCVRVDGWSVGRKVRVFVLSAERPRDEYRDVLKKHGLTLVSVTEGEGKSVSTSWRRYRFPGRNMRRGCCE